MNWNYYLSFCHVSACFCSEKLATIWNFMFLFFGFFFFFVDCLLQVWFWQKMKQKLETIIMWFWRKNKKYNLKKQNQTNKKRNISWKLQKIRNLEDSWEKTTQIRGQANGTPETIATWTWVRKETKQIWRYLKWLSKRGRKRIIGWWCHIEKPKNRHHKSIAWKPLNLQTIIEMGSGKKKVQQARRKQEKIRNETWLTWTVSFKRFRSKDGRHTNKQKRRKIRGVWCNFTQRGRNWKRLGKEAMRWRLRCGKTHTVRNQCVCDMHLSKTMKIRKQ